MYPSSEASPQTVGTVGKYLTQPRQLPHTKKSIWTTLLAATAAATFLLPSASAAGLSYTITVDAGDHDRANCPVKVTLAESLVQANDRPALLEAAKSVELICSEGNAIAAQLTAPSLLNETADSNGMLVREVHFVVPSLKQGKKTELTAVLSNKPAKATMAWKDTEGEYAALSLGDRPLLRYMYTAIDKSSPEARTETYKVFHHTYSFDGDRFITKGVGGLYTHHRGLFFGFNRISYEGADRVDTWGCGGKAYLSHEGFLAAEAGSVLGRHAVAVDWHGIEGKTFAKEQREMTVHEMKGGRLIEFASRLESTIGPVKLDGDPQHAGFHFRAAQDVADGDQNLTYYLRPDGKGAPGETRNWPGQKDFVNLPFNAMSFVIDGQRYTAIYLDKPTNPKEARFSERTYGRFGSYFEYELDKDKPLEVNYRVWLQEGEMTVEEAEELSADFVTPPKVTVK